MHRPMVPHDLHASPLGMRRVLSVLLGATSYVVVFVACRLALSALSADLRAVATHVASLLGGLAGAFVATRLSPDRPALHAAAALAPACALYGYLGFAGVSAGLGAALGASLVYIGIVVAGGVLGALLGRRTGLPRQPNL